MKKLNGKSQNNPPVKFCCQLGAIGATSCCNRPLTVTVPSAAGNLVLGDAPFLSTQQGKLILNFPAGMQLTCMPLKPVSEASSLPANGVRTGAAPSPVSPQPKPVSGSAPFYLSQPSVNLIRSSPPYCSAPESAAAAASSPQTLDHSVSPTTANTLTPESLLTLSPMYSGATPTAQPPQAAWSPVPLSTPAGLSLFDVRGKADLSVDPGLLGLPGGESLLLGSPSPERETEAASALGTPQEVDGEPQILTQLRSVPVDDKLAL